MNNWRPISEAPKDGTLILLWHDDFGATTGFWHRTHWRDERLCQELEPTHFRVISGPGERPESDVFDMDDLVMSTTAYYLGRSTIQVADFTARLIKAWPTLTKAVQDYVRKIVEDAFRRQQYQPQTTGYGYVPPLGHEMDQECWVNVRSLWTKPAAAQPGKDA